MAKAIIAKIDKVASIEGADNIHLASVLGEQVVVGKGWSLGKIGIFFPAETQLSEDFCRNNNLYRSNTLNVDANKTGFFADNRRVRCQPFMGHKSEGFFCDISALAYLGGVPEFKVGDQFNSVAGVTICSKYYSPKTLREQNQKKKKSGKAETPLFHKHVDTEQFKHHVDKIPAGALLSFVAKVHGTSHRSSYSKVVRVPVTLWQKVKDVLGLFKRESWEYLTGTRNVVLYEEQNQEVGFHGKEQFRFDVTETLKPYLEKGMTVYGEIAGYANGSLIMGTHSMKTLKNKAFIKKYGDTIAYKYGCVEDTFRFHVYRISYTNEEGNELDFTPRQITEWCEKRGINGPWEIHPPFIYDGNTEALRELVEQLTEREDRLTEDYIDPSHIGEGVVVRVDYGTQVPKFYKSKSYVFRVAEGMASEDFNYEDSN